ncbi:MAG: 4-hydroxy-tetrahydrodipicolinate synthase [Desulfobacteraceae bacterium]|jgi:4-hydroxy-tetrahydrodipicolinate synthase
MRSGCHTALITPFTADGSQVDREGLEQLTQFQFNNKIAGILAVGTTGESPTLTWDEHHEVVDSVCATIKDDCVCIAGAGSNNTREALAATEHAAKQGADAALLVDPYYNGPSSLEIRREYVGPIAEAFPSIDLIPYVIPGRTGAKLMPEDLALLYSAYPNVRTVKEATGDLDNMRRTRECCGPDFTILSGDDALLVEMMTDKAIDAAGVISVASNVAPRAMTELVDLLNTGDTAKANQLAEALKPLFGLVTVTTRESTAYGEVACRARNPLAIKTFMALLGMPSGPCRRPLGKMTRKGLDVVVSVARQVQTNNPEILQPIADCFGVDIAERLDNPEYQKGLCYDAY